jgi:hypothetical protein
VRYFTSFGPRSGALLYNASLLAIGVLEARNQPISIGLAVRVGHDTAGCALWELVVHDAIVPGRWIVVDREFQPAR